MTREPRRPETSEKVRWARWRSDASEASFGRRFVTPMVGSPKGLHPPSPTRSKDRGRDTRPCRGVRPERRVPRPSTERLGPHQGRGVRGGRGTDRVDERTQAEETFSKEKVERNGSD